MSVYCIMTCKWAVLAFLGGKFLNLSIKKKKNTLFEKPAIFWNAKIIISLLKCILKTISCCLILIYFLIVSKTRGLCTDIHWLNRSPKVLTVIYPYFFCRTSTRLSSPSPMPLLQFPLSSTAPNLRLSSFIRQQDASCRPPCNRALCGVKFGLHNEISSIRTCV